MRIKEITDRFNHDLYGILDCEHCGAEEKLTGGYDDSNWNNNVLPNRYCKSCGINRHGHIRGVSSAQ